MFGWGTSGYNSKNPYMTSTTNTDYGDGANDIAGTNYDWGVYNKISNGGNQAGLWRTPTMGEWYYLLYSRTDASNKVGVASVNNVNGLVLLPDEWSLPNDVTFKSGLANGQGAEYYKTINEYTVDDWTKMEANGAVFLPAAGLRFENQMQSYGEIGNYWSSSCYLKNDEEWAKYPYFYSCLLATDYWPRHYGLAVRLVQDAE